MKNFSWTLGILTGLFFMVCLPVVSFAADFVVSPQEIGIGTVRVLPGSSAGPYAFTIAVAGGPVPAPATEEDSAEEATFFASSDASWLTLAPSNGTVPGTITATATVSETMDTGLWRANVTIVSGLDPEVRATIPVAINVIRSIGDLLTVSPTKLDILMTDQNVSEQTFPVTIANADPNKPTDYDWSAHTDVSWLVLSEDAGNGNTQISLKVDPETIYKNVDTNMDGIPDEAVGTITFRSTLNPEEVTLTVNVSIQASSTTDGYQVTPAQLFWTVEKATDTTALTFPSQRLQVFGAESGWTVSSDRGYVTTLAYDANGSLTGTGPFGQVAVNDRYGWVEVTPEGEILSTMDYGTYTGYVTITSLDRQIWQRIPITINIRKPGEAVNLPVPEINNSYSMMEAADSSLINVLMPFPMDFVYHPTATACRAAGGAWIDPDGTPGDLDEYCSLNQHAYLLLERPQMEPGKVYAMTKSNTLALAFENGIKVSGADKLSYADGPVSYIPFGPVQMTGSQGTVVVSLRVGATLSSAVEIQRLLISLQTLEGQWKVTEAYNGAYYVYDSAPLMIERIADQYTGYTSSWEGIPVTVSTGDGATWLYKLDFEQNGIYYTYEVQSLSGNQMSGRWQFGWSGGTSNWETFQAQRRLWFFP